MSDEHIRPRVIEFDALDGTRATGEVWSPGPLHDTLWVIDPAGRARVVKVPPESAREVEYTPPMPPTRTLEDPDLRAWVEAELLIHRMLANPYFGDPGDGYRTASALSDVMRENRRVRKIYHHPTHPPVRMSEDRFLTFAGIGPLRKFKS